MYGQPFCFIRSKTVEMVLAILGAFVPNAYLERGSKPCVRLIAQVFLLPFYGY